MTFQAFIADERAALHERAAVRLEEQQDGVPRDEMGAYWLERTAALERVAEAAARAARSGDTELLFHLRRLDAIPAPACRSGDHECVA